MTQTRALFMKVLIKKSGSLVEMDALGEPFAFSLCSMLSIIIWPCKEVIIRRLSTLSMLFRRTPCCRSGRAYICNWFLHWFAVRKLGFQWFILDSMKEQPQLITDTYLHLLFEQLIVDGKFRNTREVAYPRLL